MKRAVKSLQIIVIIGTLLIAQIFLVQSIRLQDSAWIELPPLQEQRWDPKLFKTVSFGYLPIVIDWFLIKALLDPSLGKAIAGTHSPLYYHLDLVSELDPFFYDVYEAGANLLAVARKDGVGAKNLLLKGRTFFEKGLEAYPEEAQARYWSRSWNLYVLLGYVYLFELEDMSKAAEAFRKAAPLPGAPVYLLSLEKKLSAVGGEYEVGLSLLEFMIRGAKSQEVIDGLQAKWRDLSIAKFVFEVNVSFYRYLKLSNKSTQKHELIKEWTEWVKLGKGPSRDPWGGVLTFRSDGVIATSTPYQKVFGLK